jgi:hypothetical protein
MEISSPQTNAYRPRCHEQETLFATRDRLPGLNAGASAELPSLFALAMPSACRSSMISRSNWENAERCRGRGAGRECACLSPASKVARSPPGGPPRTRASSSGTGRGEAVPVRAASTSPLAARSRSSGNAEAPTPASISSPALSYLAQRVRWTARALTDGNSSNSSHPKKAASIDQFPVVFAR